MIFSYPELNVSKKVNSIEEVKEAVYELHNEYHYLAGSTWDWDGARVLDDNGIVIGKVAYNGRVIGANEEF